jgi:hypothetical protein
MPVGGCLALSYEPRGKTRHPDSRHTENLAVSELIVRLLRLSFRQHRRGRGGWPGLSGFFCPVPKLGAPPLRSVQRREPHAETEKSVPLGTVDVLAAHSFAQIAKEWGTPMGTRSAGSRRARWKDETHPPAERNRARGAASDCVGDFGCGTVYGTPRSFEVYDNCK